MGLYYKSTRNSNLKVTASEAILKGLAPDGGLFVPSELPKLDVSMSDLKGKTYQEIAYLVMKQFLTDFTANNWNVCQYAVLIYMLAQVCDMEVGEFVHVIADAHIYDRHVPMIEELISRKPLPAPKFWLNPEVKDFYQFTRDDVKLIDYQTHDQIKNIPVAV